MDSQDVIRAVVAAEGYLPLAIEKLKKLYPDVRISEYDIREILTSDSATTKLLSEQLRASLILRTYDNLKSVQDIMMSSIDSMKPGDIARLWASMMTTFTTMTAPAVKDTFDFEAEVVKMAAEFEIPVEDARDELKRMRAKKSEAAKSMG